MISSSSIQSLLKKHNLFPSHSLGQNFLIDEKVLAEIIEAADLKKSDLVLEVGPGPGNLTEKLAGRVRKVIAVEKDEKMAAFVQERLKNHPNIAIINRDILKTDISALIEPGADWKVVANIPYYLTSPLIRLFLTLKQKPQEMILLVQKEVGERIAAGHKNAGVITVLVNFYGKAEIIDFVSKESFWPMPQVDSALIKIRAIAQPEGFDAPTTKNFFRLVKIGFSGRRKTLANNLSAGLKLPKNETIKILEAVKLSPNARAQELSVEEWKKLLFTEKIALKITAQ